MADIELKIRAREAERDARLSLERLARTNGETRSKLEHGIKMLEAIGDGDTHAANHLRNRLAAMKAAWTEFVKEFK